MQIRKTIRIKLYSISFDNTWCIVPSISTGTIKSALWTGCNKTKNTLHEIHDQDSVTYWHYFAGQQPFVFERLGAKKTFFWIFQDVFITWLSGLTKQPPFCHVTSGSSKWCLRNDCRNLILMMRHCLFENSYFFYHCYDWNGVHILMNHILLCIFDMWGF